MRLLERDVCPERIHAARDTDRGPEERGCECEILPTYIVMSSSHHTFSIFSIISKASKAFSIFSAYLLYKNSLHCLCRDR